VSFSRGGLGEDGRSEGMDTILSEEVDCPSEGVDTIPSESRFSRNIYFHTDV
jgi:hypothetical protein